MIKATPMSETKKCSGCGRDLPLSEFNKTKRNKDGLQYRCRACASKYNKARYASDPDRFKKDVKAYKEINPDKVLETRIKTCASNPTGVNARRVVEAAKAAGVLRNPGVCYGCGCTSEEHRIEAHHHDYSQPLEVVWLCTPCHSRMDMQRRAHENRKSQGTR